LPHAARGYPGRMLTLTPAAAEVVRRIISNAPIEETGGLRIAAGEEGPDGTELQMTLVDAPEETDEAVSEDGVTVYLEPQVAELLDDKMLDAELDGDEVRFALVDREADPTDVLGRNGSGPDG
jgi:iron-sulfur cluster assembly protein